MKLFSVFIKERHTYSSLVVFDSYGLVKYVDENNPSTALVQEVHTSQVMVYNLSCSFLKSRCHFLVVLSAYRTFSAR